MGSDAIQGIKQNSSTANFTQPRFTSDAAVNVANIVRWAREDQNHQAEVSQLQAQNTALIQQLQQLKPQRHDTFTARPKPQVRFGLPGETSMGFGDGKKNEAGVSTFASNEGNTDHFGLTEREIRYYEAKLAWMIAKKDSKTSKKELERLEIKKDNLRDKSKMSKKRKQMLDKAFSLGLSQAPGPIGNIVGLITKPLAAVVIDIFEGENCPVM